MIIFKMIMIMDFLTSYKTKIIDKYGKIKCLPNSLALEQSNIDFTLVSANAVVINQ